MHSLQLWDAGGNLCFDAQRLTAVYRAPPRLGNGYFSLHMKRAVGEAQPPAAAVH